MGEGRSGMGDSQILQTGFYFTITAYSETEKILRNLYLLWGSIDQLI